MKVECSLTLNTREEDKEMEKHEIIIPQKADYRMILGHIPQEGIQMRCQPSCASCDCKCSCPLCVCLCLNHEEMLSLRRAE